MKILCVIPARLKSTRLPRKPLALIAGKPMIQWVFEAVKDLPFFSETIIATDSLEIFQVCEGFGAKVMMTPEDLPTGSDRVAFVAEKYKDYDVIVNVQGDEPFISQENLKKLIEPYLSEKNPHMATIATPLTKEQREENNPNLVKVILNQYSEAIYFSRTSLPYVRDEENKNFPIPCFSHIGLYAYSREFLLKLTKLPQTPLEVAEALEQLRVLEHGFKIHVGIVSQRNFDVNTPEDLEKAQKFAESLAEKK